MEVKESIENKGISQGNPHLGFGPDQTFQSLGL